MRISRMSLRAVRNYRALEIEPGPGLNLFHGENAQGKTNLLEAVFFLGALRSFRGVKAASLVAWGEKEASLRGEVSCGGAGGRPRARTLKASLAAGGRSVSLDGKRPGSAAEYLLAVRAVCFSPDDLFLVKEYPSCRRRFLDRSVFHLGPAYLELAGRCRDAVRRLNAAMRAGDGKVVSAYEEAFAPLAAEVTLRRREQAAALAPGAAELFGKVLGGGGLGLSYRSGASGAGPAELQGSYRALLEKRRAEGMKRGYCLVGPQSDDLAITISGRPLRETASRGQGRLAFLALVLADAQLYKAGRGEWPVVLLDDAASELDARRKGALVEYISGMGQVMLTSTDPGLIKGGRRFEVTAGSEGANIKEA